MDILIGLVDEIEGNMIRFDVEDDDNNVFVVESKRNEFPTLKLNDMVSFDLNDDFGVPAMSYVDICGEGVETKISNFKEINNENQNMGL